MSAISKDFTNAQRAEVLIQALPYIRKYNGQTVVIKYGGNAMIDEELKQQVMTDIVLLSIIGVRVVLVHGGGPEISSLMQDLGKEPEFVDGLRVTDKETIEIAQMVLAGKVNKTLVSLLEAAGANAMGISGMDGCLIKAEQLDERLGYVGRITSINSEPIEILLNNGFIPVVSSLGTDDEGNVYNINGDTAAAAIAAALGARRLIMMTDIDGILLDKDDPTSLIPELSFEEAKKLVSGDIVSGGMIPKLDCCINALENGVNTTVIMDGRIPHSILTELLTDEGAGTMIKGVK